MFFSIIAQYNSTCSDLTGTLTSYSERGTEYTDELKSTIRFNRLGRVDSLRIMEDKAIYLD